MVRCPSSGWLPGSTARVEVVLSCCRGWLACLDTGGALGITRRFSWRDDVPVENEPAEYAVSGADWPTLVEKFGLAPYLERRGEQG